MIASEISDGSEGCYQGGQGSHKAVRPDKKKNEKKRIM
jgi:hypothetical protein